MLRWFAQPSKQPRPKQQPANSDSGCYDRPMPDRERDPIIALYKQHVDRTLLRENLKRSVEERLLRLIEMQRAADELRKAKRVGQ